MFWTSKAAKTTDEKINVVTNMLLLKADWYRMATLHDASAEVWVTMDEVKLKVKKSMSFRDAMISTFGRGKFLFC